MTAAATKPFSKGDSVYYYSPEGDTVPATVLKAGPKKVLISGSFPAGSRNAWVTPSKLEMQPLQTKEWPTVSYLIAFDKAEVQLGALVEAAGEAPSSSQAVLEEMADAKKSFWLSPTKHSLARLMEAGQEGWEEIRHLDRHREHSAEAYNGWQAVWAVYMLGNPARLCIDCHSEVVQDDSPTRAQQPEGFRYYTCKHCRTRLVSRGNESLDLSAHQ